MRNLLPLLFVCLALAAQSQDQLQDKPITWSAGLDQTSERGAVLMIKATLRDGWSLYADNPKADIAGPRVLMESGFVMPQGPLTAKENSVTITDPIFGPLIRVFQKEPLFSQQLSFTSEANYISFTIEAFASDGKTFLPITERISLQVAGANTESKSEPGAAIRSDAPLADCGDKAIAGKSLLGIFLIGFGGGLLALLTPCIFPMIPVTVSFFTGRAKTKKEGISNSLQYGSYILLIYALASAPFHLLGNISPQIFNTIATNAWMNIFFFAVFLLFALSFFGLFEIKLPAGVANRAGAKSGIFFMALTLVIVSFSCTGIILGSLLVNALSSNGSAWQLTAGMSGFGLALALPFGLFALFPQWLKKLPKSGGWLDTVKKSLAFVELALAIKFLSNADLVEHWGILKREIFIGLWLLIALGLAAYLFGFFEKKKAIGLHNSDQPKKRAAFPWPRWTVATLVLFFAMYLSTGLIPASGSKLQLLSGFPPPMSYSFYGKQSGGNKAVEPDVINDYAKALALSRKTGKPLLIDFTGWACVNCRKMEELVWTKPSVAALIKDNYILVSLYVDDRKKLPEGGTMGQKWASFQETHFKQVTQPLYVLLSPEEQLLNYPVGYTPEANEYKQWLQCGLDALPTKTIALQ